MDITSLLEYEKMLYGEAACCPEGGYSMSELLNAVADDEVDSSEDTGGSGELATLAAKLLAHETGPEVQKIKLDILRRIAAESDIKPARIPAPMNITEIGGYFNLMMKLKQEEMLKQTLSSILGLPMQPPEE